VAISRNPSHVDVFARGFNNRVYNAYWDAATGPIWVAPQPLGQSWNVFPPYAFVNAASINGNQVQIFVTGNDQHVWTSAQNNGLWGNWSSL
jgi:hypothetical protein